MPRERTLSSPAYWFEKAQNELFRQFHYYMKQEDINQTELAARLGLTKGRVSQILRGESNFTMKTLIELSLSIRKIAKINYVSIEDEVKADELKRVEIQNRKELVNEKKTSLPFDTEHIEKGTSTSSGGHAISNYNFKEFTPLPILEQA